MRRSHTVMAVYPNSIGFGYAVVGNDILKPIDCGVVRITPVDNVKSIERIRQLIEHHSVTMVVVPNPVGKYWNKVNRIRELIDGIDLLAITLGIRVFRYSREQIRFVFGHFKAKSKQEIAEKIVEGIPKYQFRLPNNRKPWQREHYNMGMFDALSLLFTYDWIDG